MNIEHWMTFGTFAEQEHFLYPRKESYYGVIINANMATYAPDGLAAFLIGKTKDVRYIIDPLTHAFQHDPAVLKNNSGDVKSSITTLASIYGEPILRNIGKRPILPEDITPSLLEGMVENCFNFQKNYLTDAIKNSDSYKYLEKSDEDLEPYVIIPPYFYITENTFDDWFSLQLSSISIALKTEDPRKIFAEIVISKSLLTSTKLDILIENYKILDIRGFLIWIDDFDEHMASEQELKSLRRLVGELHFNNKEVINLHGGYFSTLLAGVLGNNSLTGVAHGFEYGEYRPVIPVGGGIPIAKFYIPTLHQRYKYKEALNILNNGNWLESSSVFYEKICSCPRCQIVIQDDPKNFVQFGKPNVKNVKRGSGFVRMEFPTGEAKENCLKHYLEVKEKEFIFASQKSSAEIIQNLDNGVEQFKKIIGLEGVSHLRNWKKVLTE
jgi:hypothetical protein